MRRTLSLLTLLSLLAAAALLAWRLWPMHQTPPAQDVLAGLPITATVEGAEAPGATRTVAHLRDWHLIPCELFDQDVRVQAGRELPADEVSQLYREHLDAADVVRQQNEAALRELALRSPGLPVYLEGLTDEGVVAYKLKVTALWDVAAEQVPQAKESLAEVRTMKGPKAAALAKQYEAIIERHRTEWVELGAAAGPCAEGLIEVRALEDADALDHARPRWLGGELLMPLHAVQARRGVMARRLAQASEPLVVALLGGEHHLGDGLAKGAPKARYVRVTTKAYRLVSGGE